MTHLTHLTLAFLALAGPAAAGCKVVVADVQGPGHVVEIDDMGICNRVQAQVIGHSTLLKLLSTGNGGDTSLFSHGAYRNMTLENRGDRAFIFAGACPPGTRHRTIRTPGTGRTMVLVPRCD